MIEVEYPYVALPRTEIAAELNRVIERELNDEVSGFRKHVVDYVGEHWKKSSDYVPECTLSGSFKLSLLSEKLLSLRFAFSAYTGGAYSNVSYLSLTYQLSPEIRQLEFQDVFCDVRGASEAISTYCIKELTASYGPEWLEFGSSEGAGPDPMNFTCFNLHDHGVSINFHDHQLGGKAWGAPSVLVPYHVFQDWLNPNCPTHNLQFWGEH